MKSGKETGNPAKAIQAGEAERGFRDEEHSAMKEHAKELQAEKRRGLRGTRNDGEDDLLAKIAEMPESDKVIAERFHAIIKSIAPDLSPRTSPSK